MALRDVPSLRASRLARALWTVWAVVVWNVVFDRVIVVAGLSYIAAASTAAATPGAARVNMDDYMRPAVSRGLWLASASAGALLTVGLAGVRVAQRGRDARR